MEDGSVLNTVFTYRWLAITALWLVTEGVALFNKVPGDTFTAHVRRLFSLENKGKFYGIRRTALAAFTVWLVWHFFGGLV